MTQSALQRRSGSGRIAPLSRSPAVLTAALALGVVALCLLFLPEIRAAVDIWNTSTAYGHCYLVLPMAIYLIWERRADLAGLTARPAPGWALLGLPVAAVWLVAERLGIMEGRQLLAVTAFELLFLSVLGWRLFRAVSGPLLFLYFLVPFGAFITPVLQHFTAGFTILGLDLLGIPNYSDTFVIETPSGTFFVAEACAGLRFLIAAIAFGVFYALLSYRTFPRRVVFIAASIVVPIIANGFRALGIVILGQILGSAEAAAADHIIYGWVFFSVVMLLLIAAGQLMREKGPPPLPRAPAIPVAAPSPLAGALACVVLVGLGPAAALAFDAASRPAALSVLPALTVPADCAATPPQRAGDVETIRITCADRTFAVTVRAFPARSTASPIVTARRRATEELGAEDVSAAAMQPAPEAGGAWTLVQTTDPNQTTAYASWVDGAPVRSGLAGRIAQARDSLLGTAHAPLLITIVAPEPAHPATQARQAMLAAMRGIVAAQAGLDERVERSTRLH